MTLDDLLKETFYTLYRRYDENVQCLIAYTEDFDEFCDLLTANEIPFTFSEVGELIITDENYLYEIL